MILSLATNERVKDSLAEIKTWLFEDVIRMHILLDALHDAETEELAKRKAEAEAERAANGS